MKNAELLVAIVSESKASYKMSNELMSSVMLKKNVLEADQVPKRQQIRETMQRALCAATELEHLARGNEKGVSDRGGVPCH